MSGGGDKEENLIEIRAVPTLVPPALHKLHHAALLEGV